MMGRTKNRYPSHAGEKYRITEVDHDPRWREIKNRFNRFVDVRYHSIGNGISRKVGVEKTWNEATESKIPKMLVEGVYRGEPVLAAFSAGRRILCVAQSTRIKITWLLLISDPIKD